MIDMNKFNTLFNKIINEQKNNIVKEYVDYPHLKDSLYVTFNEVIYPFVKGSSNAKNWKRHQIEDFIADLWADSLLPDLSEKITTKLFDELIDQDEFFKLTYEQQRTFMKNAISDELLSNLNNLILDYNEEYMTNQGVNPENPEDNIEEVPEDY